jgi:hypothetical protein
MSIRIDSVKDKNDWKDFLELPFRIYKNNKYWVPPLRREVRKSLDIKKSPFWKHSRRELFLARDGDIPVGRIAAIIDENHNLFHNEKTGFFGYFECIKEFSTAQLLWDKAKHWIKLHGMDNMRGPANPSMNDECGFLLDGFDRSPVIMMPYTHPYYVEFAERYGFDKAKDLYAHYKELHFGFPDRVKKLVDKLREKTKVVIRPLDKKNIDRDIQFVKNIYNAAWEKNWGFVPMTEEEMNVTAKYLNEIAVKDLVLFAEVDGKPAGVLIAVPDMNQVLKRMNGKLGPVEILKFLYFKSKINGLRLLVGGEKKEYHNTGISILAYYEAEKAAARLGYKWFEYGWTLEDNYKINRFVKAIGGQIYKKYRIYEIKI